MLNYKHTEEAKRKMSKIAKGRKLSEETKRKISEALKGRILSVEHRKKISENKERARKIGLAHKGKKLTPETIEKIRQNHHNVKGENNPMFGKKHKEETKDKIRIKRLIWNRTHPNSQSGEKNPSWKGGKSFEPYGKGFTKELKEHCRKKFNCICQICKGNQYDFTRLLDVHHIDYNKKNHSIKNLVPLCRRCHNMTNKLRDIWRVHFQNLDKSWGELIFIALEDPGFFVN